MRRDALVGTGVLVGTIVGAGFLALPYAASRAGIGVVLVLLVFLGGVVTFLHILFGEIVSSTGERHRLPGYAGMYLGPWGKRIAGLSAFVEYFGGLLVYLLFGGAFLGFVLPPALDGAAPLFFWAVVTALIFMRFRTSSFFDAAASWLLVGLLVGVAAVAVTRIAPSNFVPFAALRIAPWIGAYGIAMFSLVGLAAVPEVATLRFLNDHRTLRLALIAGTAIPVFLYAFFTTAVVGARGSAVTQNALLDLLPVLPAWLAPLIPVAGILAIGTSYFTFGSYIKNVLAADFAVPRALASVLVAAVPISLWWFGIRDIPKIITFLGGVWISVDALLIALIYERLFPARRVFSRALIAFFILGTISSIGAAI